MKRTINFEEFCDEFNKYDDFKDNFSYEGKRTLYDYLTELEEDSGEMELDVVVFCCDYAEYKNLKEFHNDYSFDLYPTIESIEKDTAVIKITEKSFIIQQF